MLEKIKKESIPDKVFELLKKNILNGTYQLGDRLPTEMELSKALGVSRVSVKSALQKLCILGITEARVGDGTYVKNLDPHAFLSELQEFLALNLSYEDIIHYRTHQDFLCMLMAMYRITDEEIAELETMLEKYREMIPTASVQEFDYMDYTFHYKLCLAGHNEIEKQVFLEWEQLTYVSIRENNRLMNLTVENREWSYRLHCRTLEAIKKKDSAMCLEIYQDMCEHSGLAFSERPNR